jgi:hypothetical protein
MEVGVRLPNTFDFVPESVQKFSMSESAALRLRTGDKGRRVRGKKFYIQTAV